MSNVESPAANLAIKEKIRLDREFLLDARMVIARRKLLRYMSLVEGEGTLVETGAPKIPAANGGSNRVQSPVPEIPRYETLTVLECETLKAIVSRILPADENGPGAYEAGAVTFIDRALAGPISELRTTYSNGLLALNAYTIGSKSKSFHMLERAEQDEVLIDMETGNLSSDSTIGAAFFNMIRTHVIEGTFSDPYYGGNWNYIGWDLLGYPGERVSFSLHTYRDNKTRAQVLSSMHISNRLFY